jgi:very-short-patch-repair endonuclease
MIMPYNPNNKEFARQNRNQHNMTESEWKIWNIVLKKDKTWYRFLRQKPIWNYILDFYCHKLKLWIEIDGKSHEPKVEEDEIRTGYLDSQWIDIIRYTNEEVLFQLEFIIGDLKSKISEIVEQNKSLRPSDVSL